MLVQILSFLHNATTMVFGIFISAFFLGVKQNFRNILILLGFSAFEGFLYIASTFLFGEMITQWCYALIIHIPLIMFLIFIINTPWFPPASLFFLPICAVS